MAPLREKVRGALPAAVGFGLLMTIGSVWLVLLRRPPWPAVLLGPAATFALFFAVALLAQLAGARVEPNGDLVGLRRPVWAGVAILAALTAALVVYRRIAP